MFGRSLGLEICTTRPYRPESNGMAEVFVKTFKRDYVWLGDFSSAARVMEQLPAWFEDYNQNAPHKGLKCCHLDSTFSNAVKLHEPDRF